MENNNEIDWNLCSNKELTEEKERLEKEYSENQLLCKNAYEKMVECSLLYNAITEILNKRNGNHEQ